ncbi:MAG: TIGR02391 family protein [Armatimonadetes bacterium]|nr:TIGR02391 family protein [Armatimonadota bacterium]
MDVNDAKCLLSLAKKVQSLCQKPLERENPPGNELFDLLVTEPEIVACCRQLFADGHYALAVEEAFKCLNNYIKLKAKSSDDGSALMKSVFSVKAPKLKLSHLKTTSEKNEQLGYMEIYSGCMTGIRNPRAHAHRHKDALEVTLELVVWANHLMRRARMAKRAR